MKIYIKSGYEDIFPESNPRTSPDNLREFARQDSLQVRRMLSGNPSTPPDILADMVDPKWKTIANGKYDDDIIKSGVYHNPNTPDEIKDMLYDYFHDKGDEFMNAYHIRYKRTPRFASTDISEDEIRKIYSSTL